MKTTTQNPKPEILAAPKYGEGGRSPKEIRKPKSEEPRPTQRSGFGLRASFGFRLRGRRSASAFGFLLLLSTFNAQLSTALAQGTAFTYQGRLNSGGSPASGLYDFRFRLDADAQGNTILATTLTNAIPVTNGLFITTIDFGAGWFNGSNYWLEVDVRTNNGGGYTALYPFQSLTPTPYAVFAGTASNVSGTVSAAQLSGAVASANLSGIYGSAVTFSNVANQFTGSFAGNGGNVTNVNAATVGGLASSNFWQLGGNNAGGSQFVGSVNNQPLDFRANNLRVMEFAYASNSASGYSPNVIGGDSINSVAAGVVGGTIGGGGGSGTNGVFYPNQVNADFGTISGGAGNTISNYGQYTFIGGGWQNTASQAYATIGGGYQNSANNAFTVTVGGYQNVASGPETTVGGGAINAASGLGSTVAGGGYNVASGVYSAIVGGLSNNATGDYATAGGYQSVASGQYSTAMGNLSVASGYASTAMGASSASGTNSTAFGYSQATNSYATAAGYKSVAGGYASTAMGVYSTASGNYSTAMGNSTASGPYSTAMGSSKASGIASTAIGEGCSAEGIYSFAAGALADAATGHSFVWNDYSYSSFFSTAQNQFLIHAAGGVGIGTNGPTAALHVVSGGNYTFPQAQITQQNSSDSVRLRLNVSGDPGWEIDVASGSSPQLQFWYVAAAGPLVAVDTSGNVYAHTFNPSSDRNLKENFSAVSPQEVLDKVAALPITRWNFKQDKAIEHLGPMAQDFHAAFGLGTDDKHIATVDEEGVALAAIQGLNQKLNEKDAEIQQLKNSVAQLRELVSQLANSRSK